MHSFIKLILLLWGTQLCVSCDSGTKWQSGKYKVYWIDSTDYLKLGYDLGDGGTIGRVLPKIRSIGEDDIWIVASRYPDGNKDLVEYFYFSKKLDNPSKNLDEIVQGPFSKDVFNQLKLKLDLPDLSIHF